MRGGIFHDWAYVFRVKNTFAERNKTFNTDKTLNKCIANAYFFSYFVTLIID